MFGQQDLPENPLPLAARWLEEAAGHDRKNPWAMALATAGAAGKPSCRYVLLKALDTGRGCAVFYTNYESRKAAELRGNGFAAGSLYWPDEGRQLRLEGPVTRSPAAESDDYFATRDRLSQLNAWASRQSRPVPAAGLDAAVAATDGRFPDAVPRPEHWGGYRIWLAAIEFWSEGAGRFHHRVRYERAEPPGPGAAGPGRWTRVELQP